MTRHRQPTGFWAVLLLLLAASPVTAPFSSLDLADAHADLDAHGDGILQTKTAKDDASPAVSGAPVLLLPQAPHGPPPLGRVLPLVHPSLLDVPLRL